MTRSEILHAIDEQCNLNRRSGRTLEWDKKRGINLANHALAILSKDRKRALSIPDETWVKWQKDGYQQSLIRAASLLVQEIERVTEEL